MSVNRDEELTAAWLCGQGRTVRHLRNGEDPPDLVVDGHVAVEVTTIASYASVTLRDFMNKVCQGLGTAEDGRGYFIAISSEDEALLQGRDRQKIGAVKRTLKWYAKLALRNHYANLDARLCGPEEAIDFIPRNGRIKLPYGVEIRIIAPIIDNPNNVKYAVGAFGGGGAKWLVPHLIHKVQSAVHKKTNNSAIQQRARHYKEWWLVVTDPHYAEILDDREVRTIADAIHYAEPWRRIFLASTTSDRLDRVIDLTEMRA